MALVGVLTPTFNRAYCLDNVYKSLLKQTSKSFKWYVVDDGSFDNTETLVKSFIAEKTFEIEYIKKSNGGKHSALNIGINAIKEELTIIVDSDDELTADAIETIEKDYEDIKNREDVAGLGYLISDKNSGDVVGRKYTADRRIDYFVKERINRNTYGDKREVWKTEILKRYPFPVFPDEKFISEAVVWCKISLDYKMLFINKSIYLCEYLEDGLSKNIHKALFNNPNGATECYRIMSGKQTNLKYRFKYTIAFAVYAFAAKIGFKQQIKMVSSKAIYLMTFWFAYLIYLKKKKNLNKENLVG